MLRPLGQLFSLPEGLEGILVPAFLGGYPLGAQAVGRLYTAGNLSKGDAQRLLAYCSNAGPSFLFGIVGQMFPEKWMVWAIWGIQIGSAFLVSSWLPPADSSFSRTGSQQNKPSAMRTAVSAMGSICGWVVVFRVLIAFLDRWFLWLLNPVSKVFVMGILELTNGCCSLLQIHDVQRRFILCAGMVSFGGLCVGIQTASVTEGLSLAGYWLGKVVQTLAAMVLAWLIWNGLWYGPIFLLLLSLLHKGKFRKNSSNPALLGV